MAEYTYENIIINPTKEGIESIIGKEVFFHNIPCLCLINANERSTIFSGILLEIHKDSCAPFTIKQGDTVNEYSCIIIKKEQSEPKPRCIPFENGREFFLSYSCTERLLTEENCFMSNHGIWLKDKDIDGVSYIVTEIWRDGVVLGSDQHTTIWDDLLYGYTFLDGSPCGKEVEE